MLTVFPALVSRPTLSKMATRALKAPWSQAGSDETTILNEAMDKFTWNDEMLPCKKAFSHG